MADNTKVRLSVLVGGEWTEFLFKDAQNAWRFIDRVSNLRNGSEFLTTGRGNPRWVRYSAVASIGGYDLQKAIDAKPKGW